MKRIMAIAAAAGLMSLSSCGLGDSTGRDSGEMTTVPSAQPIEAKQDSIDRSELSNEKHGYGQGVQVDDRNRTLGALDFDSAYGKYGARAMNEDRETITLTFDQGYENGFTGDILDTLKEKNVRAVFFLVQDYAERNPELVQRMIDEGHMIGNHSASHLSMPTLDDDTARQEIEGCHEYVKENFGVEMTLFRPPMGEFSERSLAVTQDCGYETVLWSFAYADWDVDDQPEPQAAKEKLIAAAHPGAIYLLHSVSETNAGILGEVIDGIRAEGFEFDSLA